METNQEAMRRYDILEDAIADVLSATLQSKEAGVILKSAFPSYGFTDETGATDSILASITKVAKVIALSKVDDLLSQSNTKQTLDTIDAQFLGAVVPQNDSMDVQTPITSLPNVTLADVSASCKKKELEKLNSLLTERVRVVSELQEEVNAYIQALGSVRGKITSFSQNAEEVFHMAMDVHE